MNIRNMGGHSGCRILLCEKDNGETFVRKISKDFKYNERLRQQAEKQELYSDETISVPRIYTKGVTDEGLYYFDMEYIRGITLAEYMNTIEIGKIQSLVEKIVRSIYKKNEYAKDPDESVFREKISSLQQQLEKRNDPLINKALEILSRHSWNKFTQTRCHGDLTLENIIVKDEHLYLIDFLDSFYDSWLLDVGTLLQDIQLMWSYRHKENNDINTMIRLAVFKDILLDNIRLIDDAYVNELYYALLLKLMRIYPYSNDEKTYTFLADKTKLVMSIIAQGEDCR